MVAGPCRDGMALERTPLRRISRRSAVTRRPKPANARCEAAERSPSWIGTVCADPVHAAHPNMQGATSVSGQGNRRL